MSLGIGAAERGWLPDWAVRRGIRRLLRRRLAAERRRSRSGLEPRLGRTLAAMRESPIALATGAANAQHYEVPAEFFRIVLGPRRKYSACAWPDGVASLDAAEAASLERTCARAGIADGMRVLDLGCGWGSLALWIARRYPATQVVAVSNAASQRRHVEAARDREGLGNLDVVTADMNRFEPPGFFDRIVSVEMFEHMRNYERLLGRIRCWLEPAGRLFVHLFAHRRYCYFFEDDGDADWMARHFFTGGMMPSADLLPRCLNGFALERRWSIRGRHYERTLRAWLARLDARRAEVEAVLSRGRDRAAGRLAASRWRLFLLACAELFGYRGGAEWGVVHYLLRPAPGGPGIPLAPLTPATSSPPGADARDAGGVRAGSRQR